MNCVFAYTNQSDIPHTARYTALFRSCMKGDVVKLGALLSFFVFVLGLYTITVNISSTEGYYYAQALKSQDKVNFQHNITKLNVMTMQSNLRNILSFDTSNRQNSIQELIIRQ